MMVGFGAFSFCLFYQLRSVSARSLICPILLQKFNVTGPTPVLEDRKNAYVHGLLPAGWLNRKPGHTTQPRILGFRSHHEWHDFSSQRLLVSSL